MCTEGDLLCPISWPALRRPANVLYMFSMRIAARDERSWHCLMPVSLLLAPAHVWAADVVPLTRGFYVRREVPCREASNASLDLFIGSGFRYNCRVLSVEKLGNARYRIA